MVSGERRSTTMEWKRSNADFIQSGEELMDFRGNLTITSIAKTDHGPYICQAANQHTTTNITTLVIVESKSLSIDDGRQLEYQCLNDFSRSQILLHMRHIVFNIDKYRTICYYRGNQVTTVVILNILSFGIEICEVNVAIGINSVSCRSIARNSFYLISPS
jgi:hypothetical protein